MPCRQLKAEHLKRKGDQAIQQGNFKEAYQRQLSCRPVSAIPNTEHCLKFFSLRYSEALNTETSHPGLHKLYGNRSLAYSKAHHYHDALADAKTCIELAPHWAKGHWRLGMAFLGLKQTLQAIQAFAECWRLDRGMQTAIVL